jgi:hypothetical protein
MKTAKTGIRIDGKYVVKRGKDYFLTNITEKDSLDTKTEADLTKYKKKTTMRVKRLLKSSAISSDMNVNFSTKRSKKMISKKKSVVKDARVSLKLRGRKAGQRASSRRKH